MILLGAFRGNKEIMDICRSYSKDEVVMKRLNLWNALVFVIFGFAFSFFFYMEYLPGSRSDYTTSNALEIYKNVPSYFHWMLTFYIFCLMQMLNDNIQFTIYFIDNVLGTKFLESKYIRFSLAICFALFNNFLIGGSYKSVLVGVHIIYPNVFIGIPLLVNLQVQPYQSLGRILSFSSLIATFFFFSLYCTLNL